MGRRKSNVPLLPDETIKPTAPSSTKSVSMLLSSSIVSKLQNLDISGTGTMNLSKTVRSILENFLDSNGSAEVFIPKKGEIFVPIEMYEELVQVGKLTLKNRAAKGEIKITMSFGNEYVVLDENETLNVFAQMVLYKQEVASLKAKFQELEKDIIDMKIEKRLTTLENKISQ